MSSLVLMENAGRGLAELLQTPGIDCPVAICCGKGNNAGDGFVLARHLDLRRHPVRVLVWASPETLAPDAAANFRLLEATGVSVDVFGEEYDAPRLDRCLDGVNWIVDALLGTGARGAPRPPLDAVIRQINAHPAPKLAVDLPSGLDCDTGVAAEPTIRAAQTGTFVAPKIGFLAAGASQFTGQIHVLDIGAPRRLVEQVLAEAAASR